MISVGVTSAHLAWSPGGVEPVESYVLRVRRRSSSVPARPDGNDEIVDITVTEHTLTELTAHVTYTAQVFAVNNIGRSLPTTIEFTTAEDGLWSRFVLSMGPTLEVLRRIANVASVVLQLFPVDLFGNFHIVTYCAFPLEKTTDMFVQKK